MSNDFHEVPLQKAEQDISPIERTSSYMEKEFYPKVLPKILPVKLKREASREEIVTALHLGIKPVADNYIDKYKLPTEKLDDESDFEFFNRVMKATYTQNQQSIEKNGKSFGNCWPTTALEDGQLNCSLGTLVVARVLERAGIPEDEMFYGWPNQMQHAVLVTRGYLIDHVNGVVLPIREHVSVVEVVSEGMTEEEQYRAPYRKIPTTELRYGAATIITNLGPLASKIAAGAPSALKAQEMFGQNAETNKEKKIWYGQAGFDLLPDQMNPRVLDAHAFWINESVETDKRMEETER